jgi:hypothetical protein
MDACGVEGCSQEVSKKGFKLCYEHWQAAQAGTITACVDCEKWKSDNKPRCASCFREHRESRAGGEPSTVTASQLGEKLGLKAQRINLMFQELGWVTREGKGWVPTTQGAKRGASVKAHTPSGVHYVLWPASILEDRQWRSAREELLGHDGPGHVGGGAGADTSADTSATPPPPAEEQSFRDRYPATHRAVDGHLVRSRAETIIDNWLYQANVVHAYERRVPIDEELYCDFYLPAGRVYIEFWGMEADARYAARKRVKQGLYAKHGLNLIELDDEHLRNIDDHLPRFLLKHGIQTL